ncbi:hypothetical protein ACNHUS_19225 [Actinomycetes bacterium M1A6_2h]
MEIFGVDYGVERFALDVLDAFCFFKSWIDPITELGCDHEGLAGRSMNLGCFHTMLAQVGQANSIDLLDSIYTPEPLISLSP